AGHWLAPDGGIGTLPKWLAEAYAESLPSNIGDDLTGFHNAIDNPESPRFGATFVDWIDEQHPGFLHALTKASIALNKKPWTGSPVIFQQITGQSFDALF